MVTTAAMGNPRHDAESRLDSIDFQLKALRDLIAGTSVLAPSGQTAPVPATSVSPGSPAERFEQTVLATFGGWVLKELAVEGLDVTEKVRAAHDVLSEQLGLRERERSEETELLAESGEASAELFSSEDLDAHEEVLDISPVEIQRDEGSGPFDQTSG